MGLELYHKKRNFARTPEPKGREKSSPSHSLFVIQKHAASRLHYDFRLELDGVLKSWAIPKGPSFDPQDKRLAVEVEDHPLDYGGFEGIIPHGQYGGGTVMLWDRGSWTPIVDPHEGLKKGSLKFTLEGEKLKGTWALVRMHGPRDRDGKNWLLIKERDDYATSHDRLDITASADYSVLSGRDITAIAADKNNVWQSNRSAETQDVKVIRRARQATKAARTAGRAIDLSAVAGAKTARCPKQIEAQLATLTDEPPRGDTWIFELKLDGYRLLSHLSGGQATLKTRHHLDWTARFQPIAEALRALPVDEAWLDGEVVVLDERGVSSFQALQNALSLKDEKKFIYYVFDLLYLNGHDLREAALVERKRILKELLSTSRHPRLCFSDQVAGEGDAVLAEACRMSLEGVIAKRAMAPYRGTRNRDWLKLKCGNRQEFVIIGYTDPKTPRDGLGALHLGVYDDDKKLHYVGKSGTGFSATTSKQVYDRLKKMTIAATPALGAPRQRTTHWVKPELVCEIEFSNWTGGGAARHAVFCGLREDKKATEVRREAPVTVKKQARIRKAPPVARAERKQTPTLSITNPDRVLYPDAGFTKHDVARFYEAIQDAILPHLIERPLTVVRCPEGYSAGCFFQKHAGKTAPEALRRLDLKEEKAPYFYIDDFTGLMALVQLGSLELHTWGSRVGDVERPDRIVFDLDPDINLPWREIASAARTVREQLGKLGLESFLKTTGGKGLHVVVPITPHYEWEEVKAFTKAFVEALARMEPQRFTPVMSKSQRRGKIYLDYLRNSRGATAITAYSTRARPGATVSVPLAWQELSDTHDPRGFNIVSVPTRLAKQKKDPWRNIASVRQSLTAHMVPQGEVSDGSNSGEKKSARRRSKPAAR